MNLDQYEKLISQILAAKFDGVEFEELEDEPTAEWLAEGVTAWEAVGMIIDSQLCHLYDGDIRFHY